MKTLMAVLNGIWVSIILKIAGVDIFTPRGALIGMGMIIFTVIYGAVLVSIERRSHP